jgi:hypothetical protein
MKHDKCGSNTKVMKTEAGGRDQEEYQNHVQMGPETILQ